MSTGYGRDLWCTQAGLVSSRFASGKALLAQACVRRLITRRGEVSARWGGGDYGLNLMGWVGAVDRATAIASLPGLIRGELIKDDRIRDVTATVTTARNQDGTLVLTVSIMVLPANSSGQFRLTLDVSAVSLDVLGIDQVTA